MYDTYVVCIADYLGSYEFWLARPLECRYVGATDHDVYSIHITICCLDKR